MRFSAKSTAVWLCVLALAATVATARTSSQTTIYEGNEVSADSLIVDFDDPADAAAVLGDLRADAPFVTGATLSLTTGARLAYAPDALASLTAPVSHAVVEIEPGTDIASAIDEIGSTPGVAGAYANHVFYPLYTPNDPGYSTLQQNYRQIYVDRAWDTVRGAGVTVAVIDTGYHVGNLTDPAADLLPGYDFWGSDDDPTDYIGHGTHVANTVGEATDNGVAVAGIAHEASILPLKVFPDSDGGAYENDIIDAINYAVEQGASVINMSLGGAGSNQVTARTLDDAWDAGVVSVCATGNDGDGYVDYPAAHDGCIAVGSCGIHATGATATRSDFSNYGAKLDLVAPGELVFQESYFYGYGAGVVPFWGTSSASPHVAGVAALMISGIGVSEPDAVKQALTETAQDAPPEGWDQYVGWGEVNAQAAVARYAELVNQPPEAAFDGELVGDLEVAFSAAASTDSDGTIALYAWDFGDGSTGDGVDVQHTYDAAETYSVVLMVTDDKGDTDTASRAITLDEPTGDDDDDDSGLCTLGDDETSGWAFCLLLLAAPWLVRIVAVGATRGR